MQEISIVNVSASFGMKAPSDITWLGIEPSTFRFLGRGGRKASIRRLVLVCISHRPSSESEVGVNACPKGSAADTIVAGGGGPDVIRLVR